MASKRNTPPRGASPCKASKPNAKPIGGHIVSPSPKPQRAPAYVLELKPGNPDLGQAVARFLGVVRPIVAATNPKRLDWLDGPALHPAEMLADAAWAGGWIVQHAPAGFPVGRLRVELLRWLELLASCLDAAAQYRSRQADATWVDALDETGRGDDAMRACEQMHAGFHGLQTELLELEARAGVAGCGTPVLELERETKPANTLAEASTADRLPRLKQCHQTVARAMLKDPWTFRPRRDWAKAAKVEESVARKAIEELESVGWAETGRKTGSRLTTRGKSKLETMLGVSSDTG